MSTETKTDFRSELRALVYACYAVNGDPEDCDDCGDLEDRPCKLHSDVAFYQAVLQAERALGSCLCGHERDAHHSEDTTRCKTCRCRGYEIPRVGCIVD